MDFNEDIVVLLKDLLEQATVERSHYYTGRIISIAIWEIERLRKVLKETIEVD